jgi:hypothetical protein
MEENEVSPAFSAHTKITLLKAAGWNAGSAQGVRANVNK